MDDIIKLENSLNRTKALARLTSSEIDLFLTIANRLKDKGTEPVILSRKELLSIAGKHYTDKQIRSLALTMAHDLIAVAGELDGGTYIDVVPIFSRFRIAKRGPVSLEVQVDTRFSDIFTAVRHYTLVELQEIGQLRSTRAKTLYRLCKQYRSTGELYLTLDQARDYLQAPARYPNKYVWKYLIAPATADVRRYIPDLVCVTRRGVSRGRPVTGYSWYFTAEKGEVVARVAKAPKGQKNMAAKGEGDLIHTQHDWQALEDALLHS